MSLWLLTDPPGSLSLLLLSQSVCLSMSLPSLLPLCLTVSVSPQEGQGTSFPAVRRHGQPSSRSTFLLGVYTPRRLLLHNSSGLVGSGRLRTLLFGLKGQAQNDPW